MLSYRLSALKNASSAHDNKAETQQAAEGEINTEDETQPAEKNPKQLDGNFSKLSVTFKE